MLVAVISVFIFSAFSFTLDNDDANNSNEPLLSSVIADDDTETAETLVQELMDKVDKKKAANGGTSESNRPFAVTNPSDTTKNGKWKAEFTKKFKQYFGEFYEENKEEVDRMIAEMDASLKEQMQFFEVLEAKRRAEETQRADNKAVELDMRRLELQKQQMLIEAQAKKLQLESEIQKTRMELELKAKRLQLEKELQKLQMLAQANKVDSGKELSDVKKSALTTQLSELKQVEMLRMRQIELEKAKNEIHKQQLDLELRQKEMELRRLETYKKKEKTKLFIDELTYNLIEDGYITANDRIKTVHFGKDGKYKVGDKNIKKKHHKKYGNIYAEYYDEYVNGLVIVLQ